MAAKVGSRQAAFQCAVVIPEYPGAVLSLTHFQPAICCSVVMLYLVNISCGVLMAAGLAQLSSSR
eukprot:scaffold228467_cov22-Attheya_sp.AAC.1